MKLRIYIFLFFISVSSICQAQKPKDLIGKWNFDKMEYKGEFIEINQPESSKKVLAKLMKASDPNFKESELDASFEMIMGFMNMITYTFSKDGNLEMSGSKGTYTLKKNQLTIKMDDSKEETNTLITIKGKELVIQDAKEKDSKIYFKKS